MFILYFILGILFVELLPLLEELISLFSTMIEASKGKLAVKIAKYNEEIGSQSDEKPSAIGFVYPTSEEEYGDDE